MFKIIKGRKNTDAVTDTYLNIISKAYEKSGVKSDLVITDNVFDALKLIKCKRRHNAVWLQGIIPEESYMRNRSKIRFFVLSGLEKYVLKQAELLFLVSRSMLEHYEEKYHLDLKEKSVIMPCFNETEVNQSAFECEEKYKNNTFLYLGGLQAWQCFNETVKIYKEIEQRSSSATRLYVFTPKKAEAKDILEKHNIKNYELDCVDKDKLSDKIKDIKYGFVLRENSVVNNVATPTKLSNYLANGIIPIYSSAINDFCNIQKQNGLGIICDLDTLDLQADNILADMEKEYCCSDILKKCENTFKEYYNKDFYINEIAERLKTFNN